MWVLYVVYLGVAAAATPTPLSGWTSAALCEPVAAKFNADVAKAGSYNSRPYAVCSQK